MPDRKKYVKTRGSCPDGQQDGIKSFHKKKGKDNIRRTYEKPYLQRSEANLSLNLRKIFSDVVLLQDMRSMSADEIHIVVIYPLKN